MENYLFDTVHQVGTFAVGTRLTGAELHVACPGVDVRTNINRLIAHGAIKPVMREMPVVADNEDSSEHDEDSSEHDEENNA